MTAADGNLDRNTAIALIRRALRGRSGKAWSVTGGRGTAWGWITIDAPPARCTWSHRPRAGFSEHSAPPGVEGWEEYDCGAPGHHMSPEDRSEIAGLLRLEVVHSQGVSIPAGLDYYREFVDRAAGMTPSVVGVPYWD